MKTALRDFCSVIEYDYVGDGLKGQARELCVTETVYLAIPAYKN